MCGTPPLISHKIWSAGRIGADDGNGHNDGAYDDDGQDGNDDAYDSYDDIISNNAVDAGVDDEIDLFAHRRRFLLQPRTRVYFDLFSFSLENCFTSSKQQRYLPKPLGSRGSVIVTAIHELLELQ